MKVPTGGKMFWHRYPAAILAFILLGSSAASAQNKSTKPAAPAKAATPAACIVVNGPSGAHLQVGLAPNGDAGCVALP